VIGAHSGSYCIYRALAVASGTLDPVRLMACCSPLALRSVIRWPSDVLQTLLPDLEMTAPSVKIGPFPSWFDPKKVRHSFEIAKGSVAVMHGCIPQSVPRLSRLIHLDTSC
jgi:hypothetical protein